jgi:hypothetical protein
MNGLGPPYFGFAPEIKLQSGPSRSVPPSVGSPQTPGAIAMSDASGYANRNNNNNPDVIFTQNSILSNFF